MERRAKGVGGEGVLVSRVVERTRTAPKPAPVPVPAATQVSGVRPRFSGPTSTVVNDQDFGSAEIAGTAVSMTLQYAPPLSTLTAAATGGRDFKITSSSCTVNGCTVTVSFAPAYPGVRSDAITLTDSNGQVLYKTFVHGVGLGPQFGYELGNISTYYGFTASPQNVAIGPDQRVYYTSTNSNAIYRALRDLSSADVITISGLSSPSGIAVDGSNTLYVADRATNVIFAYNAAGMQSTLNTSPLSGPSQITVDGTGALYVADTGHGRILKINNQGVETTLASGLSAPTAVAVDSQGSVFYADTQSNGSIYKLPSGSSTPIVFQSGLNATPIYLALDGSGAVYLTTDTGLNIFRMGSSVGYGADGANLSIGITVDGNGDIFLTQPTGGTFSITDRGHSNFILNAPTGGTSSGTITISNTGNETLNFSGFAISGTAFSIDPANTRCNANGSLDPDTTCDVTVQFMPPAPQDYHEVFTATSDSRHAPGSTNPFDIAGYTGADSTTTLTASPNPVQAGTPVSLLVSVTDQTGANVPTGTITFMDGTTTLGTATLAPDTGAGRSSAQFTVAGGLSVGSHSITASYSGDNNIKPSSSSAVTVVATNGPPPPNGGAPVDSKNFGSVQVGQSVSMNVTYPAGSGNLHIEGLQDEDFGVGGTTCASTCVATVMFQPEYPGLRSDVITVTDSNGAVVAKTFVYGNGVAPQFAFDNGNSELSDGPEQTPTSVAVDRYSNAYITDAGTGQVYAHTVDAANALPIVNLGAPSGIAIDAQGVLYVTDRTHNQLVTFNTYSQQQGSVFTSPLSAPSGVAVDGAGSVYVADAGNRRVIKIDNQGAETTLASGINGLGPIAVDNLGNVFYATTADPGVIVKLPTGGGQPVQIANNISFIHGLAVDAGGRVYFTNDAGLSVLLVAACAGCPLESIQLNGFNSSVVNGLALGQNGDIYVTSASTGQYVRLRRSASSFFTGAYVGSTSQESFFVANTGNAPLTLSSVVIAGNGFRLDSGNGCTAETTLQAGVTCKAVVDFSPGESGSYNGSLTYTSNSLNDPSSTNVQDLQGTGTALPEISTTTTLVASPSTAAAGETVTLTATVTEGTNTPPSGTVTFLDGSATLGTAFLGYQTSGGTASAVFTTSTLAVGTHSITASYAGDPNFRGSASSPQSVVVTGAPSGPVITSQAFGSVRVGQTASMTIVYPQGTNPTISAVNNLDFVVSTVVCTTGCTATISFTPQYPGLRTDAVTVKDSNGTLLAKTFVYGVGTAPQFGFNTGYRTTYPNFVQQPTAIALAQDGTAFVSDAATNKVIGVTLNQQGPLPISGLVTPAGLALDGSNTLYIADSGSNVVRFYNLVTQAQGVVTTPALSQPSFLAVDGKGQLYIVDSGHNRIFRVDNQGVVTTVVSSLRPVLGIALGSDGTLYYADDIGGGRVVQVPASGGEGNVIATQLGTVGQIAIDAAGSIYLVGDSSSVRMILPNGTVIATTLGPAGVVSGIALAANGDVYTTQASTGTYSIDPRGTSFTSITANVGQTVQGPAQGVVNTGNLPLTVSGFVFTTGTGYSIDGSSTCAAGSVIAPGALCNTVVDFSPPAAQTYNDRLTFTSNSLNATAARNAVIEQGTGVAASLAPSTTTLSVSPNTAAIGQAVTFTATVSDTAQITPTGSVSFVDGSTVIGTGTLVAGGPGTATAQFATAGLALGGHSISAVYGGSTSVAVSSSAAQSVTVTQAATTTALGVSAASLTVGQTETLTATIAGGASPVLTGSVTFFDGTTQLGSVAVTATANGGSATLSVATLGVGSHSITARYGGDTNYVASVSAAQSVTVTQVASAATLAVSAASITVGQSETLTATVQGVSTPALTGSVTFFDGATQLGSANIVVTGATGTASFTAANLGVGTHSITARYSGDTNYTAVTTAAQTVTVAQASTTTALSISAANITVGQSETLTATVQGLATPALTGSVTFFDGATSLGSATLSVSAGTGTATLSVSSLTAGSHAITARYAGDTNYTVSTSTAQTVTVAQAATATTLAVSGASISAGQNETLTATVQALSAPALTGSVTFFDGQTMLGSGNLSVTGASGTASFSTTTLGAGTHSITARFGGDANYGFSVSAAQTVTVALVAQTITFPAIPNHMFGDAPFALAATASSGLAISYTVLSGPATVSGSTVTLTGAGTVSIQAAQAGNATYAAATPVTQTFNVATPTPVLTSLTPATAVVGASATTITLTGSNFASSDTVQVNGTGVATTFVSATSLTAVIPASVLATAGAAQVRVFDASNAQSSAALTFTVLAAPAINFSGPTSSAPAQQPALTFQLVNPYPVPITGTLTLTFAPQSTALTDDPAVQFAAGGRILTFTIPANSQTTPNIQLQTGTVAGRVTITLTVTANSVNVTPSNVVPVVINLPAAVPAVSSATATRSGKTFTVTMQGYSNTRELTTATFHFTAASGASITNPDITAQVTAAFATWFASPQSAQYGSTFTYTQDFNLSDDASTIGSVTVTLVNSIGSSITATAQ